MPYRADFYIQANIIGYTGDVNSDPTVYLMTGPAHGPNQYGHITQAHDLFTNVGREDVGYALLYEMRVGAGGELEEWADGHRFHTSRNAFIAVTPGTLATLAQAIGRYPDQKRIGDFPLNEYFDLKDKQDKTRARSASF